MPPDRTHWERHSITSVTFPPETHHLIRITRWHETNINWETLYQSKAWTLRECQSQEKTRNRIKETKEVCLRNARSSLDRVLGPLDRVWRMGWCTCTKANFLDLMAETRVQESVLERRKHTQQGRPNRQACGLFPAQLRPADRANPLCHSWTASPSRSLLPPFYYYPEHTMPMILLIGQRGTHSDFPSKTDLDMCQHGSTWEGKVRKLGTQITPQNKTTWVSHFTKCSLPEMDILSSATQVGIKTSLLA